MPAQDAGRTAGSDRSVQRAGHSRALERSRHGAEQPIGAQQPGNRQGERAFGHSRDIRKAIVIDLLLAADVVELNDLDIMSRIGPPPGWKKKPGFGCQCSMPCDIRVHEPARMDPTLPSSTISRAKRPPAPRNVSGAQPNFSPRRFASWTSRCPSSAATQSGFSENTCRPCPGSRDWWRRSSCVRASPDRHRHAIFRRSPRPP